MHTIAHKKLIYEESYELGQNDLFGQFKPSNTSSYTYTRQKNSRSMAAILSWSKLLHLDQGCLISKEKAHLHDSLFI